MHITSKNVVWPNVIQNGRLTIILCFSLFFTCQSDRPKNRPGKTGPGFFSAIKVDSILDLTLTFDYDELGRHRDDEKKIDAALKIGNQLSFPVRIGSRGVTRKKICDFPPLHIYLTDSISQRWGWGSYKKYKLVTHCMHADGTEDLLLKEYLAYQLYNLITPTSLRVQLCRVLYKTELDTSRHLAFLIEDDDEMASRINAKLLKENDGDISQINKLHYQNLVMFQYMIGNTDWNLPRRHNMRFVLPENSQHALPVPYDFDYSGLVNAPYAFVHPSLPVKSVRERFWQYRGNASDDFRKTVDLFISKKSDVLKSINDLNLIADSTRQSIITYISSFYEEIESPEGVAHLLQKTRSSE